MVGSIDHAALFVIPNWQSKTIAAILTRTTYQKYQPSLFQLELTRVLHKTVESCQHDSNQRIISVDAVILTAY